MQCSLTGLLKGTRSRSPTISNIVLVYVIIRTRHVMNKQPIKGWPLAAMSCSMDYELSCTLVSNPTYFLEDILHISTFSVSVQC